MGEDADSQYRPGVKVVGKQLGTQFLTTFKASFFEGLKERKIDLPNIASEFLTQIRHILLAVAIAVGGITLLLAALAVGLAEILHRPHWEILFYFGVLLLFLAFAIFRMSIGRMQEEKIKLKLKDGKKTT